MWNILNQSNNSLGIPISNCRSTLMTGLVDLMYHLAADFCGKRIEMGKAGISYLREVSVTFQQIVWHPGVARVRGGVHGESCDVVALRAAVVVQFRALRSSSNGRAVRPRGYRDHMKQPGPSTEPWQQARHGREQLGPQSFAACVHSGIRSGGNSTE